MIVLTEQQYAEDLRQATEVGVAAGRALREKELSKDHFVAFAALILAAGGEVNVTRSNLMDAIGSTVEQEVCYKTGGYTLRCKVRD